MKIRKLLALLMVLSMVLAVMPAFGLTASAAITVGQGIVTSTGDAYAANSDDLIFDGSFESDEWESALTTGAYVDSSGGVSGKDSAIPMNTDEMMLEKGETAFVRVEGRTGDYAISPAFYAFTPDTSIPRYTNDENGPTSIKHYILNDNSAKRTTYYVSFWAKSLSDEAAKLRYYIGGVKANAEIPSSQSVAVSGEEWVQIDAVVEVNSGDYLLINVFDMGENAIALDDFEACVITKSSDANTFGQATAQWPTVFGYTDGQLISDDMVLPSASGKATVSWESSDPEIVDPVTGKIAMVRDNTPVTLWATLTYRTLSYTYTYNFTVAGFLDRIEAILTSGSLVGKYADPNTDVIDLPKTIPGFDGSVVSWASSDESIIAPDGTYNAPNEVGTVTLTATVTFAGETIVQDITVYVGAALKHSLIENGSFEVVEDDIVPGWTVGDLSPMNVGADGTFEYVTDPDTGNHFIVSKGHASWDDPNSIRLYVDLEPGKFYTLSFKMWYYGTGSSQESYTAAVLVPNKTQNINNGGFASVGTYGGFAYPGGSYNGRMTKNDGWQTVNVGLLKPDSNYHTLLISAEWLNKTDGGQTDGRWAFDDFILEEVVSDFTANVTINYLNQEGNSIKSSKTVRNQYGNIEYYADSSDKADITTGSGSRKKLYRYDPERSVDHVLVSRDASENVINLYFNELVASEVTINYLDRATGDSLKKAATDKSGVYVGYEYTVPDMHKEVITIKNEKFIYDSTSDDTIIISEDPKDNVINLYFNSLEDLVEDVVNIIENGDFSDGYTGWTTRTGAALSGGTIAMDSTIGKTALTISTGGRDSATAIGTSWKVTPGKQYYMSFWIGGSKPTAANYTYNRLTDAVNVNGGVRECAGNGLIEFGQEMTDGQWKHLEIVFTAQTDTVYFQSSWVDGLKLADFVLGEIGGVVSKVTINYLDSETNEPIKDSRTVNVTPGVYNVPAADKADFEQDGYIYVFNASKSQTSANVAEGSTESINLYFDKTATADITINFLDMATGNALKPAVTVSGAVGQSYTADSEYKTTITVDGTYYIYSVGASRDTITVSANASENVIDLYFEATNNLIPNGDFSDGLTGWTNRTDGAVTDGTVAYDNEIGANALTISTGGRSATNSIGTVWKVEVGKTYKLSFDVGGTKPTDRNYEYNVVSDARYHIEGESVAWDATGNIIIPYGEKMVNGKWTHMETTFEAKTDMVYFQSGWADTIKFANFMLTEVNTDIKGNVTINFLDVDTKASIKAQKFVNDITAGTTYTVDAADLANITVDGSVYYFVADKSDNTSITVKEGSNVINLYFKKLVNADVTIKFVDGAGNTIKNDVKVTEEVGNKYTASLANKAPITINGVTYVYDNTSVDAITVSDDAAANVITLYFTAVNNLIENGNFATNDTTGWTNRSDGTITDYTIAYDAEIGANALSIKTGGRAATASIGTVWKVEVGKTYVLSFDVGGAKPEAGNYQYNVVSDGRAHTESQTAWDVAGNIIIPFGETMENGKWTHMEAEFVAQTDMLYFESSWALDNMKFANFVLYEVDMNESRISISDNTVTVKAADEAVTGVLVIAQYDANGALVKAETKAITVDANTSADTTFETAAGATKVKAMVIKSFESLEPVLKSASK